MQETTQFNSNTPTPDLSSMEQKKPSSSYQMYIILSLSILLIISLGISIFSYSQTVQLKKMNETLVENMTSQSEEINAGDSAPSPTTASQQTPDKDTATTLNQVIKQDIQELTTTLGSMSITYPTNWKLSEISTDPAFPLKKRFGQLYGKDEAIALSNGKVSLIITVDEMKENMGAGGSFANDEEYQEFAKNADTFTIDKPNFYLSKKNEKISELENSESGPWGWGALNEYFPEYQTQAGTTVKAYDSVIKRNGKGYNFILVSATGGQTDAVTQKELVSMLKTIKW